MIQLSPPRYEFCESFRLTQGVASYSEIENDILAFEKEVQKVLKTNRPLLALNSATAAIHLSLLLAEIGPGDEVLCQSFTFIACANPILYVGATPVFIGSEPQSRNMCPDALEEAYFDRIKKGKRPKAIIVASLYGTPFNYTRIHKFAKEQNLILIDDSAEALGAFYDEKACGTLGDYGVLSFNYNKIITASGGGILVCPTKAIRDKALYLSTQAKHNKPYYHHTEIGYNYRINNLSAQIGLQQLALLEKRKALRKYIFDFYCACFSDIEEVDVYKINTPLYHSNHWLTTITIKEDTQFSMDVTSLQKKFLENNIETRMLWKPLHTQPLYKDYPYYGNHISVVLFNKGLCLPSGPNLTEVELNKIEKTIFTLFKKKKHHES